MMSHLFILVLADRKQLQKNHSKPCSGLRALTAHETSPESPGEACNGI